MQQQEPDYSLRMLTENSGNFFGYSLLHLKNLHNYMQ